MSTIAIEYSLNIPGPVVTPASNPRRAGAPNHHHNSGSGGNPMVDANLEPSGQVESTMAGRDAANNVVVDVIGQLGKARVVRLECLSWALASGQDAGAWGGLTGNERRSLNRRRASAGSNPRAVA